MLTEDCCYCTAMAGKHWKMNRAEQEALRLKFLFHTYLRTELRVIHPYLQPFLLQIFQMRHLKVLPFVVCIN